MATKDVVTKVWIEPGCIVCDACENTAPTVFEVTEDSCIIRPAALESSFLKPITQEVIDAAEECPVDVIKFDTVAVEVSDAEAAAAPTVEKTPAAKTVSHEKHPAKSPEAPTPKPVPEPATAAAAKSPVKTSTAGSPDPAIAALLRAATSRGGNAGMLKNAQSMPTGGDWDKKSAKDLPPDAKQAKVQEAAKKVKEELDSNRREFMGSVALKTGWVAVGLSTGVSAGPGFVRFLMPNVLEEPDPRVRVGKIQRYIEMAPGEVNEDYKPQGIWMVREEERIAALSIICTHLGCIPNWLPNDRKFKCPCHGSGYKPNGINFEGPTPRPLERFRIFVEDGIVIVDKSKKFQFELGQWDQPGCFLLV